MINSNKELKAYADKYGYNLEDAQVIFNRYEDDPEIEDPLQKTYNALHLSSIFGFEAPKPVPEGPEA